MAVLARAVPSLQRLTGEDTAPGAISLSAPSSRAVTVTPDEALALLPAAPALPRDRLYSLFDGPPSLWAAIAAPFGEDEASPPALEPWEPATLEQLANLRRVDPAPAAPHAPTAPMPSGDDAVAPEGGRHWLTEPDSAWW